MPSITRYPTAHTTISGGAWNSPQNAYSDDGLNTSVSSSTVGTWYITEYKDFGFDSLLPAAATIDSVVIEAELALSTTLGQHTMEFGLGAYVGSSLHGSETVIAGGAVGDTFDVHQTSGITTLTRADLLNWVFGVRLRYGKASAYVGNVDGLADYVRVVVNYTLTPPINLSGTLIEV